MQADYVVVAMSGNFVQRGAPAIIDKYARTKMALSCGADLVIELPVLWATASAEYFAMAGVTLFDKMGCVDGICFGAETDDLDMLSMIAEILADEPANYQALLSSYLKDGFPFPTARSKALCEFFSQSGTSCVQKKDRIDLTVISSILKEPNNILGIEYLKSIKRRKSALTPYVLKRNGAGYHDEEIIVTNESNHSYELDITSAPTASATGIRKLLHSNTFLAVSQHANSQAYSTESELIKTLANTMPTSTLEIIKEYASEHALLQANDFSSILGYQLLCLNAGTLAAIGDSNADVANRMLKNRMSFTSFEQFCERNKSKDITYTRMNRILMHLILQITNADYCIGKGLDYIPYLRMLGFRKNASALLKELKRTSHIPVISKLADASSILDMDAMQILEKDIFVANLYSQVCATKSSNTSVSEYSRNIILI